MDGHVIALGNYSTFLIEDCTGVVSPLLDVRREGGATQRNPHLLSYGSIERAINLNRGWIKHLNS
jgi:hypothetical protein